MTGTTGTRSARRGAAGIIGTGLLVVLSACSGSGPSPDGDPEDFTELTQGTAVYDATGDSLTADEVQDLEARVDGVEETGADVVLYVRDLDASPEETLEQVEVLHEQYAAVAGVEPDTAVAVLINRDPDDDTEARAGIFAGTTWNDGAIPEGEQEAIVEDVLIPPLREGDVNASFAGALDRVESNIRNGPPRSGFQVWSQESAGWVPWAGGVGAVLLLAVGAMVWGRRARGTAAVPAPTTQRPGDLTPALGSALALGGPQATAFPATVVDLAARRGVAIEPDGQGNEPAVRVRLLDETVPRDAVERAVWSELAERADDKGVVSAEELSVAASSTTDVTRALTDQLRDLGYLAVGANRRVWWLMGLAVAAAALAVLCLLVAVGGGGWPTGVLAGVLGTGAIVLLLGGFSLSRFSPAGQDAGAPWRAYRAGLEQAAKDDPSAVDLDTALPDVVAMNLASGYQEVLEDPAGPGGSLRAFQHPGSTVGGAVFPFWAAWTSTVTTSSSSSSTVSTTTSSGGGAAGST